MDAKGYSRLGAHAEPTQTVRESIGLPVELGVRQPLVLKLHRRRVGRPACLRLEELVDASIGGVADFGAVPVDQHAPALLLAQERQRANRLVGSREGSDEKRPEVRGDPIDRRGKKQIGRIGKRAGETGRERVDAKAQGPIRR